MLRLTELRLPLDHAEPALRAAVLSRLALRDADLRSFTVFRRAWDARKKSAVVLIYTVDCELKDEATEAAALARLAGDSHVRRSPDTRYHFIGHAPIAWPAERRPRESCAQSTGPLVAPLRFLVHRAEITPGPKHACPDRLGMREFFIARFERIGQLLHPTRACAVRQ